MHLNLLIKLFVLSFFLLIQAEYCFSQKQKDTVFLTNGSIIVGEIKNIKLGVITFDPDDANEITIQLRKLKSVYAVSKVFHIETIEDILYFGTLIPYNKNKYVALVHGSDTTIIFLEDISSMYPFEKTFMQRFSGNIGLGYSYTRSSGFGRFNYDGRVNYVSKKEVISLTTSGIYTITDSSFSRDNENVFFKNNYYFSPTWFGTILLSYQRNLELGLQRRYQEGVGAGNKFITSKHIYAWARSGLVINQEQSTEDVTTGTLAEIFGQIQFNLFRFTKPEVNLDMTQSFYYNLSQSGRFRNDGETSLNWEIIEDLKLNLSFYNNYDSKPPVEGSRKFDYNIVFGVNYSF